jgi:tetratricopeptide (TPR) repeat protein
LGMTQWKMFQNYEAYRNWAEARKIFKERQILFQNFPDERAWYKNQLRRMNADLARRPEEIWTWLNWFERSSLRPPTQQVIDCVQEKIRGHAYPNVYALMQDLQEANRRCKGGYEQAEIFLEFGLAIYEMGNTHFAIELLRKSVLHFFPGVGTYHKQVVARCMLGAVEWMDGRSHNQAEADWTRCIEEFEKLGQWANQDNNPTKKEWYTEHSVILCDALLDQRRKNPGPPSPDPRPDIPEENDDPKPPPSTPSGMQTYSYEDLLSMVGRDQAVADRLIEYERKMAPNTDRNKLITRAIERLLRDRQ